MKYYSEVLDALKSLNGEWTTPTGIFALTGLYSYQTSRILKKLEKEGIIERKILNKKPGISPRNYKSEYRFIK